MRDRTSTWNMDCLDYMKSLPDNAFDLIIADPSYLGSGSSRIAAYEMGFEFVGIEKDEDYFHQQEARFRDWTSQGTLDFDALE